MIYLTEKQLCNDLPVWDVYEVKQSSFTWAVPQNFTYILISLYHTFQVLKMPWFYINIYIHVPFYCLILIIPSRPILGFNKHSILNFYSLDSNVDIFAGEMRTQILLFNALCTHVCSPYLYRAVIKNEKYKIFLLLVFFAWFDVTYKSLLVWR
mgnify:CR=1 FL=1